MYIILLIT